MTVAFAAIFAGFVHVLSGPDHLAAIAPYAVGRKGRAWRIGFRWGVGHTLGVIGVGALALLLRDAFSLEPISIWGERFVGLVLLCIGIKGISVVLFRRSDRRHEHPELPAGTPPGESNSQSNNSRIPHAHGRVAFGVGTLHGLAGSSHLLGIVPALAMPSESTAISYLLLFGVGSVIAMAIFAALVGWIATRRIANSVSVQSVLLGLCSLTAIAIGCYWIFSDA